MAELAGEAGYRVELADARVLQRLAESSLVRGSPPHLSKRTSWNDDVKAGVCSRSQASPHPPIVPLERDEGAGVEDQSISHVLRGRCRGRVAPADVLPR